MSIRHPLAVKILIPVQLALSILSIPSGALLLHSPGGEAIGAQTILPHLTRSLPFIHDFTVVGIFLIAVYGILPLILSYGLWDKKRWAWVLTVLQGITEIGWITAEVVIFYDLGFFFFYPIIAGMGMITVALCALPSVRKFYSKFDESKGLSKVQQRIKSPS
ncbi:MAG: DUF2127 domain-containing protein [Thaumarchaeota archaeon]|nr:DUF2127 domain-containing protein [Nitrososphaerota archaeon]